jgi:hypothetical protein
MKHFLICYTDNLFNRIGRPYQVIKAEVMWVDEGGNLLFFKTTSDDLPFAAFAAGSWLSVETERSEDA